MSWGIITDAWRLKLLAFGLAILMLGAVAVSQNPPTSGIQAVPLSYANLPKNLTLINPPNRVSVTYTGISSAVARVPNCSCLTATVDLRNARPGTTEQLNVVPHSTLTDISLGNIAPINLTIDNLVQDQLLQVQVAAHAASGWSITKTAALCPNAPCVVHFSGPATWLKNMSATVTYPGQVNIGSIDSPNQPIQLTNSTGLVDLTTCRTYPCAALDNLTASIHIEAVPGSNSSTVVLIDSAPSHGPANGYRITGVTITPNTVNITGDPTTIGKIRTITLPPMDLTGKTSDTSFPVNIPYPDGVSGSVAQASIKYSISPNPNVSPAPG